MRLLIIGALEGQLSEATKMAMNGGAKVAHAPSVEIALAALRAGRGADLLLVDVVMDIAGLIAGLEAERIAIPVVACGVEANAAAAVNAIRAGAKEYIPLPPDAELIAAVIAAVARESSEFLFRDPAMERVVRMADQIAGSDASILITGESGTGKEVIAKYVHARSKRANKPFISVNCAAIPEALLESELFGHEKGAFTGAIARRIGKFEEASGGTLLLDEISEMDVRLQAKLLRAIQERLIDRVGGGKPVPVDIRILATSNRNLADAVREGSFREDLLFRLNVVNLKLPALRDRPGDIIDHYARWSRQETEPQLAVIYASMYGNTRRLAEAVASAASREGVKTVRVMDVSRMEPSFIISDMWTCRGLVLASPTYNTRLFPLMASMVDMLQNMKLKNRFLGLAGTYGWSKGALAALLEFAKITKLPLVAPTIEAHCAPTRQDLDQCDQLGREMARALTQPPNR